MSMMDHEELAIRLERRLEKIETKLDKHLELVSTNKADISWIRGHLRVGVSLIIATILGLVTTVFKVFFKV